MYYPEDDSSDNLRKLIRDNVCAICGRQLYAYLDEDKKVYLACPTPGHEGIAKEYIPKQIEENSYEGGIRRMVQAEKEHGPEKMRALAKYQAVTSLTQKDAMEIMETIWPDAPAVDKKAAAILCAGYNLNPLMNHVFLIKFGNKWARVLGIKAKRLISSRQGAIMYLDMSPRIMTEAEQIKAWGRVDNTNVCFMTYLRDAKSGAEAYGYGKWPKASEPYGTDKGNSKENMAAIRSESQALDRLRPGEMPTGIAIADEQYVDTDYKIEINEETPTKDMVNDAQRKKIFATAKQMGYTTEELKRLMLARFNTEHTNELTKEQASGLIEMVERGETETPEERNPPEDPNTQSILF